MNRRTSIDAATLRWMAADALDWNQTLFDAQVGGCESAEVVEATRKRIRECERILKRLRTQPGPIAQALDRSRSTNISEIMKWPDTKLQYPGSAP